MSGFSHEDALLLDRAALMKKLPFASLERREELLDVFVRAARLVMAPDIQEASRDDALRRIGVFLTEFCSWLQAPEAEVLALLKHKAALRESAGFLWMEALDGETHYSADSLKAFLKESAERRARERERKIALLQQRNERINARNEDVRIDPGFDRQMMELAISEAKAALAAGEVPVGAVLAIDGKVLARAGNRVVAGHDPTAHAEMIVIRSACAQTGSERLSGATLYVTLEPCGMCAAAISAARVSRVVWAAADPQRGAFGGKADICEVLGLNHRSKGGGGVLADEARALLQDFFKMKRNGDAHE